MKDQFEKYQPRKIAFKEVLKIDGIQIKMYTITNRNEFSSLKTLQSVVNILPNWLNDIKNSNIPTHKNAFLIVHEAREGVLTLLNWWTGENMIETKVYFSGFDNPTVIVPTPYKNKSLICVWELEIFYHERISWIQHVLSKPENPDFKSYANDYYIQ